MKIEILSNDGMPIELVRYFNADDRKILIFLQDNSTDNDGHVIIHVSKVENNGQVIGNYVSDEDWELVKNCIKNIVNANKNNQPVPVEDLDYNMIQNISITGDRALKLMANYVDLLKINQPIFEKNVIDDYNIPVMNNNVDYENIDTNDGFGFNDLANNSNLVTSAVTDSAPIMTNDSVTNNVVSQSFDNNNSMNNQNELDYKTLYFEQLELVNQLRNEMSSYINKIETVKSIINN